MTSQPNTITGHEARSGDGSARDALIDFYRAFNAGDLDALAANWAEADAPSMDNPIGGIRRGWPAIRELTSCRYIKAFSSPTRQRSTGRAVPGHRSRLRGHFASAPTCIAPA